MSKRERSWLHFGDWPYLTKLLIVFGLIVMLPLLLTFYYGYSVSRNNILENQAEELSRQANFIAFNLDFLLNERSSNITIQAEDVMVREFSATWPDASQRTRTSAQTDIENLAGSNPFYEAVYLMDPSGEVILSTADNLGDNFSFRPYFQKAILGEAHISDLSISVDAGIAVIYFSAPVRDSAGDVVAVAVLRVLAEEIWDLALASEEEHASFSPVVLFDEYGIRLAHTIDPSLIFKSVVPLDSAVEAQLQAENRLGLGTEIESTNMPDLAEGILQAASQTHFTYLMDGGKEQYHAGAARLQVKPWTVIEAIPESAILSRIYELRTTVFLAVVVIGLVSLIITTLAARSITKPIGILTTAVQKLSVGAIDQPLSGIRSQRKDEIGVLARSFESMRQNLKGLNRHVEELSVLHAIATAGIEATSEDELILEATRIIGLTLYPSNYGILLLDSMNSWLLEHDSYLRPREDQPLLQVPLGKGISGMVAKTGKALRIGDVRKSPDYISANPEIISELCVPIKSQQHVLGVINLESKEKDAFTEDDERLLQTIASQLAVGIENVRLFEEASHLAITDDLTGLNSRRFFFELARKEFERSRRFDRPLVAIMLDLDIFKRVNDDFGHSIGDQALAALAEGCTRELREVDVIGRYGGDEFSILLPETDLAAGKEIAERLCAMVSDLTVETERGLIELTISLGVASLQPNCPNVEKLLDQADMALYDAKQSGRNQVCIQE